MNVKITHQTEANIRKSLEHYTFQKISIMIIDNSNLYKKNITKYNKNGNVIYNDSFINFFPIKLESNRFIKLNKFFILNEDTLKEEIKKLEN